MGEAQLYGDPAAGQASGESYKSPPEYADQGDKRVVRDMLFTYVVQGSDAAGNTFLDTREAQRDEEVTVQQIGLAGLKKGEGNRSFYTTDQLKRKQSTGQESEPVTAETNLSALGEQELAEWLATNNPDTGRPWTINEVLEKVGDDKDLANRMLAAENIRGDGDPRDGLEQGLTKIIES